jgi:hypothetical protein
MDDITASDPVTIKFYDSTAPTSRDIQESNVFILDTVEFHSRTGINPWKVVINYGEIISTRKRSVPTIR